MFFLICTLLVVSSGAVLYSFKINANRALIKKFFKEELELDRMIDPYKSLLISIEGIFISGRKIILSIFYSISISFFLFFFIIRFNKFPNSTSQGWKFLIIPIVVFSILYMLYIVIFRGKNISKLNRPYKEKMVSYIILTPIYTILLSFLIFCVDKFGLFFKLYEFYNFIELEFNSGYIHIYLLFFSIILSIVIILITYITIGFYRRKDIKEDYWFCKRNILVCVIISSFFGLLIFYIYASSMLNAYEQYSTSGIINLISIFLASILIPTLFKKQE